MIQELITGRIKELDNFLKMVPSSYQFVKEAQLILELNYKILAKLRGK